MPAAVHPKRGRAEGQLGPVVVKPWTAAAVEGGLQGSGCGQAAHCRGGRGEERSKDRLEKTESAGGPDPESDL